MNLDKKKYSFNVKIGSDSNVYLEINRYITSTIYDIKIALYNKIGIHPNHQRVIFNGNIYKNNILLDKLKLDTLNHINIVIVSPKVA